MKSALAGWASGCSGIQLGPRFKMARHRSSINHQAWAHPHPGIFNIANPNRTCSAVRFNCPANGQSKHRGPGEKTVIAIPMSCGVHRRGNRSGTPYVGRNDRPQWTEMLAPTACPPTSKLTRKAGFRYWDHSSRVKKFTRERDYKANGVITG